MKLSIVKIGFLFFLCVSLFMPTTLYANTEKGFSADKAYEYTKYLAQKIGPRPAGSKSELKAAQYIYYVLEQNGWKVREQPFSKIVVRNSPLGEDEEKIEMITSQNIIAELPGKKPESIILGAHYDTDMNSPGALDNGSGVGVLLELSKILSQSPHEESYQLVFFGAEEAGLVGSSYFVSQADLSAVKWMLNLDMVGTPVEIDVAGKKSAPPELVTQVTDLAKKLKIPFHLGRDSIVMTREGSEGGSSDFSSFLDHGIPALGIGIAGRPSGFYHRPEDKMENVSLESLKQTGEFALSMIKNVDLKQVGPRTWDELYIPFQIGSWIIILPSIGLRIFYLITFLFTVYIILRVFKSTAIPWKRVFWAVVLLGLLSLIVTSLSGMGEGLWQLIKGLNVLWYAHPGIFLGVRVGIGLCLIMLLMLLALRLPVLPRQSIPYFLPGVFGLLVISMLMAMVRLDLAFPLVFWLLCFDLLFIFPNFIIAFIGPYFFYRFHWELLNSSQWLSYYETAHSHYLIFTVIYSLLLLPLLLSIVYVAVMNKRFLRNLRPKIMRLAFPLLIILILGTGLVPPFTRAYPQIITVRQDWQGSEEHINIASQEPLPRKLQKDLSSPSGRSINLPYKLGAAPLNIETVVSEKANPVRSLDLSFNFKFLREPQLVRFKIESEKPFIITQMDDFLPLAKLPKKVQLEGKYSKGSYSLIIERNSPPKNTVQMTIEPKANIKCTVEAVFADNSGPLIIQDPLLSVDYQSRVQQIIEF